MTSRTGVPARLRRRQVKGRHEGAGRGLGGARRSLICHVAQDRNPGWNQQNAHTLTCLPPRLPNCSFWGQQLLKIPQLVACSGVFCLCAVTESPYVFLNNLLFLFFASPQGMQGPSALTRDQTFNPALEVWTLTPGHREGPREPYS